MSDMYLGLDFGTSSVKAVLISETQKILGQAHAPLSVSRPRPGWSEQNPAQWWRALQQVMASLQAEKPKQLARVAGIGLSGQMHGATLLDARGKVLRPAILWNDGRATAECDALLKALPHVARLAGNRPLAGFTAPKLLWLKQHEPEIFNQIARVLLPKDYMRWRMTGDFASDMSDASGTLWLDVAKRQWSDELLAATGMARAQMPELFEGTSPTGRLTPALAKAWGLPLRPIVAGGAGDNAASACGLGAIADGAAFVSLGTSGVLFTATKQFRPNPQQAVHAFCHAIPDMWHQMGVILSATASMEWLAQLTNMPAPALTRALGKKITGPAAELFLPYLAGERTPVGDSQVRAVLLGLSADSSTKHLTHAVLDGVAFALRQNLESLRKAGSSPQRLLAVGGGSQSALWLSIIATVLNLPVDVPARGEVGAAFGAARLGLIAATGLAPQAVCTPPAIHQTILPDAALQAAYDAAYQRYTKIYPAMKEI